MFITIRHRGDHAAPATIDAAARSLARRRSLNMTDWRRLIVEAPRGAKGQIVDLAKTYRDLRAGRADPLATPLATRFDRHLLAISLAEIERRALSAPAGWDDFSKTIRHYVPERRLWLVAGSGWYEYSRRHGKRFQEAVYLCGRDEGQLFAVRVPSTITTVYEAEQWLMPAAVRKAREKGLPILRQGDVFFAPVRIGDHDMSALSGTRHTARIRTGGGLTIRHPEHKAVTLSKKYRWRAYISTQIDGNSRRAGD